MEKKPIILLVDDRKENLLALTVALDDLPLTIQTASSGQEALELLRKFDVALVLLDVAMPVLDGFETAAMIRDLDKERKPPILFLTAACVSEADIRRGLALGAVDYLTKPFSKEVVRTKVQFFLDLFLQGKRLEKELIAFPKRAPAQLSILLVDDQPQNLQSMQVVLEPLGERILLAKSGVDALSYFLRESVDLLIADIRMPEMDGFELVRTLRTNDRFRNLPIILVSAVKTASEDIASGYFLGVVHFIISPYVAEIFRAKVSNLIEFIRQKKVLAESLAIISSMNRELVSAQAQLAERNLELKGDVFVKSQTIELQEARFQSLVNTLPGFVWTVSATAQRLYFSPQALDLTGFTSEDLAGPQAYLDAVHPDDRDLVEKHLHRLVAEGASYSIQYRFRHRAGHWLWFQELANSVTGKDQDLFGVGFTSDITQQVTNLEKERLDDRLKTIGLYSSGIAHDFNNILGVIQVNVDLIESEGGRDNLRRCVSLLRKATSSGSMLVQQMKNMLKGATAAPTAKQWVDLDGLLQETIPFLKIIAGKGIRVESQVEAGVHTCFADPIQIQQVILNLGKNGIQAMEPLGRGVLRIDLCDHRRPPEETPGNLEDKRWLRLSISDSGPGFDPETEAHLFEPFHTTKSGSEGTGLGLYMVKAIVQDHGGWIHPESIPGKGARFHVFLPRSEKK